MQSEADKHVLPLFISFGVHTVPPRPTLRTSPLLETVHGMQFVSWACASKRERLSSHEHIMTSSDHAHRHRLHIETSYSAGYQHDLSSFFFTVERIWHIPGKEVMHARRSSKSISTVGWYWTSQASRSFTIEIQTTIRSTIEIKN